MKTSARNEFNGVVHALIPGSVNTEVVLDIGKGQQLVAIITNESVVELGLAIGVTALALIKAPWVILMAENTPIKTSARNRLCGVVSGCEAGAVNGEVVMTLDGGHELAAIILDPAIGRVRLHTLSCTGVVAPRLNGISHCELSPTGEMPAYLTSGSSRLALYDSGCVIGHVQSPDLG